MIYMLANVQHLVCIYFASTLRLVCVCLSLGLPLPVRLKVDAIQTVGSLLAASSLTVGSILGPNNAIYVLPRCCQGAVWGLPTCREEALCICYNNIK